MLELQPTFLHLTSGSAAAANAFIFEFHIQPSLSLQQQRWNRAGREAYLQTHHITNSE